MVPYFQAKFVLEAYVLGMSETQAIFALSTLFTGSVQIQHEAVSEIVVSEERGVSSWPEAVQYLLTNFTKSSHISSSAISNIRA